MRRLLLLLALLPAFVAAQTTRTLRKGEFNEFYLVDYGVFAVAESKTPENTVRHYTVTFYNDLPDEVQSVDLRFWIEEGGKTTYAQTTNVAQFYDYPLMHLGSALPDRRSGPPSVTIDQPARLWSARSQSHFEVVAVQTYVGEQDLHDFGHLYSWLVRTSEEAILRRIKEEPSILSARNGNGIPALGAAYAASTVPVIRAMIAAGAEFQPTFRPQGWEIPAVQIAASNEKVGPLSYLIKERGMPIDALSTSKQTALHIAFDTGRLDCARWLLENGANPNLADSGGNPPSFYAIMLRDRSGLDALVKAGANLRYHNPRGYGLMHKAATKTFVATDVFEKLKSLGLAVDDVDPKFKITPLMIAARNGRLVAARWFLANGANPRAKDASGDDVLAYAGQSNSPAMEALIQGALKSSAKKP